MSNINPPRHLWEYDTDRFPNAGSDISVEFEDWSALRVNIRRYLGPLNVVYSWWWCDPEFETWITGGEDEARGATFHVTVGMAYRTVVWWCPIERSDEPEVRQVLAECARWLAHRWAPEVIGATAAEEPPSPLS